MKMMTIINIFINEDVIRCSEFDALITFFESEIDPKYNENK